MILKNLKEYLDIIHTIKYSQEIVNTPIDYISEYLSEDYLKYKPSNYSLKNYMTCFFTQLTEFKGLNFVFIQDSSINISDMYETIFGLHFKFSLDFLNKNDYRNICLKYNVFRKSNNLVKFSYINFEYNDLDSCINVFIEKINPYSENVFMEDSIEKLIHSLSNNYTFKQENDLYITKNQESLLYHLKENFIFKLLLNLELCSKDYVIVDCSNDTNVSDLMLINHKLKNEFHTIDTLGTIKNKHIILINSHTISNKLPKIIHNLRENRNSVYVVSKNDKKKGIIYFNDFQKVIHIKYNIDILDLDIDKNIFEYKRNLLNKEIQDLKVEKLEILSKITSLDKRLYEINQLLGE